MNCTELDISFDSRRRSSGSPFPRSFSGNGGRRTEARRRRRKGRRRSPRLSSFPLSLSLFSLPYRGGIEKGTFCTCMRRGKGGNNAMLLFLLLSCVRKSISFDTFLKVQVAPYCASHVFSQMFAFNVSRCPSAKWANPFFLFFPVSVTGRVTEGTRGERRRTWGEGEDETRSSHGIPCCATTFSLSFSPLFPFLFPLITVR